MKKLLIITLLLISTIVRADIIIMSPIISINTKIANINSYPDIVFVTCTFYTNPALPEYNIGECSKLDENQIIQGYRSNYSHRGIFAIEKTLYENTDVIDFLHNHKITKEANPSDPLYNKSVTLVSFLSNDANYPIESETRTYYISTSTNDNITLKLSERVITFNDGTADKTIEY